MNLDKVPIGLRHIIARATKHEKEKRYQTVAELMDAIEISVIAHYVEVERRDNAAKKKPLPSEPNRN